MNKIIEVIKQVIATPEDGGIVFAAIGLLIIVMGGLIIGVFKQYNLIAGVNTAPKKELEKIDLEYVGKWMGIYSGIFGFIMVIYPFIFKYLNISKYNDYVFGFVLLTYCAFLFLHIHFFKKDRTYKKSERI